MKRNLDLCYLILQKIADSNEDCCALESVEGYSDKELFFNANLLEKENLIEATIGYSMNYDSSYLEIKLTWTGFNLYDQMTSERTFSVKNGVSKTNFCNEYKALDYFYSNYNR